VQISVTRKHPVGFRFVLGKLLTPAPENHNRIVRQNAKVGGHNHGKKR
jgi:hypothetical protein